MSRSFIRYKTTNGFMLKANIKKKSNGEMMNQVQDGIFARLTGVLSEDIFTKRVLVIGVGSVGSYMSEQLVRSGVSSLIVIDPELVEYANLSRTNYTVHDVGKPKVKALERHLSGINPAVRVISFEEDIQSFSASELTRIFLQSDVVVGATDDPQAQRTINRFAYGLGKPAVFVGLYDGAEGGEVIVSLPDVTPCYQCATNVRHELEHSTGEVGRKTDYGTGKLEGVVALAADIHHVASAAVKMVLSLLVSNGSDVKLKGFVDSAVDKEFSYLTFSMKDQYWFYPHVFQGVAGQYAYQSVWLTPVRDEGCMVCGKVKLDMTSHTMVAPVKTPTLASIRKAVE